MEYEQQDIKLSFQTELTDLLTSIYKNSLVIKNVDSFWFSHAN